MLKVSLDEGYVFDILSINQLKMQHAETEEKRALARKAFDDMLDELSEQISECKISEILSSQEYNLLVAANWSTFQLVENVRKSPKGSLAKTVDSSNIDRFLHKRNLQEKFFGTRPLEVKTQVSE